MKTGKKLKELEDYVGRTSLVAFGLDILCPKPDSLSELVEQTHARIEACESKLEAICEYLGVKVDPVEQKWQIRSKDEDRKESN